MINSFTLSVDGIKKTIGLSSPAFIIAEMSANHLQDFELALKIIDAAKEANADAIKLQTYTPDTITMNVKRPEFTINDHPLWKGKTYYDLYQKAFTPWQWHKKLKDYAEKKGLIFFSTPFDVTAVDFLESLNVPLYKIGSFETEHLPLLKKIASTKKPVILSRGTTSFSQLKKTISILRKYGTPHLAILHCVSAYPAKPCEMNLSTILQIQNQFDVIPGLSDHTLSDFVPTTAIACGAKVIEKHLTLSRNLGGPDAAFSLEPSEFKTLVTNIRKVETIIGSAQSHPTPSESIAFKPSIFINLPVKKGEKICKKHIRIARPGKGLSPMHYERVLNKKALKDLEKGHPLSWDDLC